MSQQFNSDHVSCSRSSSSSSSDSDSGFNFANTTEYDDDKKPYAERLQTLLDYVNRPPPTESIATLFRQRFNIKPKDLKALCEHNKIAIDWYDVPQVGYEGSIDMVYEWNADVCPSCLQFSDNNYYINCCGSCCYHCALKGGEQECLSCKDQWERYLASID